MAGKPAKETETQQQRRKKTCRAAAIGGRKQSRDGRLWQTDGSLEMATEKTGEARVEKDVPTWSCPWTARCAEEQRQTLTVSGHSRAGTTRERKLVW